MATDFKKELAYAEAKLTSIGSHSGDAEFYLKQIIALCQAALALEAQLELARTSLNTSQARIADSLEKLTNALVGDQGTYGIVGLLARVGSAIEDHR